MTEKNALEIAIGELAHPDTVDWETFKLGEQEFQIRPMVFEWDMVYRSYAMPIFGAELKPIEALAMAIVGPQGASPLGLQLAQSIVESELEADLYLAKAVGAICASQDPKTKNVPDKKVRAEAWAKVAAAAMTRQQLMTIIQKEREVQKDMEHLGESLRMRLERLAALIGKRVDFGGLWQGLMPLAPKPSEPTGPSDITGSKSSGSSTDAPATTT